jgi:hypothetical protein
MSTPKKYVPVICTEIRNNGKPCGGHFKSDLSGNFYCMECGIQYQDAFGHAAEDFDSESLYDQLDNEAEEATGMSSLYQKEQDTGSLLPASLNQVEARLKRNIDAYRKAIGAPSVDELRAKEKLHEKAETDRKARKATKKAVKQPKAISVYDSKQSAKKKAFRLAAILAWAKDLGTVSSSVLRKTLEDHHTPINRMEFARLLKLLEENGRISLNRPAGNDGEDMSRVPFTVTFLH